MNTKDFLRLGVPLGQATRRATDFVAKSILVGGDKLRLREEVVAIVGNSTAFVDDPLRSEYAKALISSRRPSSGGSIFTASVSVIYGVEIVSDKDEKYTVEWSVRSSDRAFIIGEFIM